MKKIKTK